MAQTVTKWLNKVGAGKGEGALKIVRTALENNINSNITHYEELASLSSNAENGNPCNNQPLNQHGIAIDQAIKTSLHSFRRKTA